MPENQNIEWKESWRDEYLKWICGFANAQGGKLYIGKNNNGEVVALKKSKKLLDDIPNKVRDILGILVDVNLHKTENGDFLEINVEPQPFPVNHKGQYHYRSGSTKQELKGAALDKFMLEKKGKKWDGVAVQNVSVSDLKNETFEFFKKRATTLILAHNHPGGIAEPSNGGIEITDEIKKALELVEISLQDHIILANNDYFSLI